MSNTTAQLERAELLLEQGRVNDSIREVKNVLQQEPENDEALALYARCLYDKNEFDEGVEVILKAISLDPENSFYFYLLGFGYYRKDINYAAIENLSTAIRLNPYQAEYYGMLAFVYLEEKDFEKALAKADEGLAIDAESITCLNARSTALNKLKRVDAAIETMENSLSKDPDNEFTHTTVGWNYLEKGRHKEATTHFREALRISPNHHNAKIGLKEALKSKIPPYRWLLQFSFWMSNKGKSFRWMFIIGGYLLVRAIIYLGRTNHDFESTAFVVAACYFLFIATSWIIGPLANVFLLFHKDGKHALENSERWNAIAFMICIACGVAIMTLPMILAADKDFASNMLSAGLIVVTLCVPAGHMDYPIRFKGNSLKQWLSIGLGVMAIASVILAVLSVPFATALFLVYFVVFVVYTWAS
jgi:tetratricopeptide (TPR) repeat protein